ncbi:methyltransferase domain-containing protein [Qipengyuania sp. 6B39]|uniref:methyltransferase n=1 Tax=Qipengyuania proteolytica TaxID=2867239 RepID=UPI001C89C5B8|nr:methyltransferase [Qipengyuania proteolytica]MBX7497078.1 methyltransferase domain-containing protein [Qipengyuania proteolytica]
MARDTPASAGQRRAGLKQRWVAWRNRLIGSSTFQRTAASNPLTRAIARRRSAQLFDLVAGFTYTQTLLATVESGLLDHLEEGPRTVGDVAHACDLGPQAAQRLLRAAAALDLAEEVEPDCWMLGEQGAALHGNAGARAMIRHHRLLYADLADPLALLRDDRSHATALSAFWSYVGRNGDSQDLDGKAREYSELMASSQALVAEQVLAAYDFGRHASLLDVGGGSGAFAEAVAVRHPGLRLGIFDLPEVTQATASGTDAIARHSGSFFSDPIPGGYDAVSLVRILHDHDDDRVMVLLRNIRASLAPGARLIVAEPMAQTPGAEKMGDAYFGLYLWAMRSGRPRSAAETGQMLAAAGFADWRRIGTDLPVITSLIVATA